VKKDAAYNRGLKKALQKIILVNTSSLTRVNSPASNIKTRGRTVMS
jgi:hypothetical protein